jgi:hypothetical protein
MKTSKLSKMRRRGVGRPEMDDGREVGWLAEMVEGGKSRFKEAKIETHDISIWRRCPGGLEKVVGHQ